MSNARLREILNSGHTSKEKGPPVADGTLSVTIDAPEVHELRSRRTALDCVSTSSTYLEEDTDRLKPSELYGKFTWKIERFSETSKRELRSNVFEVGQYKWYILVYPQGCDVCNHLSLFLCVADYDKLLPGWCHFAQFTIAVVNKDPKKSKYSDTLHRFCKKEHDWGWKKFMELSKILDGFTMNDTLVIKAQIQVIRDYVDRPFRCLDPQYRQELVRVYLSNVEGICRRFIEESRDRLSWLRADAEAFKNFWKSLTIDMKKSIILEAEDVILKGLVKRFFNEKEVTSTLVMDAIFCGCRQVEETSQLWIEGNRTGTDPPHVLIDSKNGIFFFAGDILHVIEAAATENIILSGKDLKDSESTNIRSSQCDDSSIKDSIVRDEHRLAELGRKTVEMFVISHIFTDRIEIAYQEAECLKRQEELLREEEEAEKLKESKQRLKAQSEKEKRSKRKEKKKVQREAERQKKANEEAELRKKEQERKKEAERRKQQEQEQKRILEEKLELEHQQALEEARKRAEIEAAETAAAAQKQKIDSQQSNTITSPAPTSVPVLEPRQSPSRKQKTVQSKNKLLTQTPDQDSKQRCSGMDRGPESCSSSGVLDEVQCLRTQVTSLEKTLSEKDRHLVRLQSEIESLKKRQKELECELTMSKNQTPKVSKMTQTSTVRPEPTSRGISQSEPPVPTKTRMIDCASTTTTTTVGRLVRVPNKTSKGGSAHSTPVASNGQKCKTESANEGIGSRTRVESGNSSSDETCSDLTYIDPNTCASQTLATVDPSQISESSAQETRSISSMGTQMENNNIQEQENLTGSGELDRGQRNQETVNGNVVSGSTGDKWELVVSTPVPVQSPGYPMAQSMYPSGPMPPTGAPIRGQLYPMMPYPPSRTISSASCLQRTGTPSLSMDVYPPVATRSYSFDGGINFQQSLGNGGGGGGMSYPNYHHKFGEIHDPAAAGLYGCSNSGQFGDYGFQSVQSQGSLPIIGADCTNLEGFAHLEIIKDLLE